MSKIGLVMGAGGISGIAWLMGVLEALQEQTGWDPRSADVVSGTSAGAVAAAVTAAGVPGRSLLRFAEEPAALEAAIAAATHRRAAPPHARSRRGEAARTLASPARAAWPGSVALALTASPRGLAGFLPRGRRSTDEIRGLVYDATLGGWPTSTELWLHACDYKTGKRVTFGAPGAPPADLIEAVAASCAVPAYYAPVEINGRPNVDGGLFSFANGDAMVAAGCDTVLFLSPFASSARGPLINTALFGAARGATLLQARREIGLLRDAGARVAVVEPSAADIAAMGLNPMDRSRSRHVMDTAVASMRDVLPRALRDIELPAAQGSDRRIRAAA